MNGIFFDLRTVRARDLAAFGAATLKDGKVFGCNLTSSGTILTVSTGYILACGRLIEIETDTSLPTATPNATGYGRLKLVINLAEAANGGAFTQAAFVWEYAASNSFPTLIQNNVNDGTETTYELEICRVTFSNSSISAISSQMGQAGVDVDPASIGAAKAPVDRTVTTSTTWQGSAAPFTQTISVAGVTATSKAQVGVAAGATAAQFAAAAKAKLHCSAQNSGTITLKAFGAKPTVAIPLIVRIFE